MMAQSTVDHEAFYCPICLDVLNDPVTIPCGHSYCRKCVEKHWEHEQQRHSCPQCRQSFSSRPALVKNILVAALVDQLKTVLIAPPADGNYAGPEDVPCDVCPGRRMKAVKSCFQCVASFCQSHLQPHYDAAVFQRHQLVAPLLSLQENVCSVHNKVRELYCRTDKELLCSLCVDQHKGHQTVSSASERAERQTQLQTQVDQLMQNIHLKEADLEMLTQEEQDINMSAHTALLCSRNTFSDMALLLKIVGSEVEQKIHSEQETQLKRVHELQNQLQQDVTEMRETISQMDSLFLTPDHNHFLLHSPESTQSLWTDSSSQSTEPARIQPGTHHYFQNATKAVSALREKLQVFLKDSLTTVSLAVRQVDVLLSPPLTTREVFIQYSQEMTLDPNTANTKLCLSNGNRKARVLSKHQDYPDHVDRFSHWPQVLSRESVSGRCYWELTWTGSIRVAVSYKDIERKGGANACLFGFNDKSWALHCDSNSCSFCFNSNWTELSGPAGYRLGIFLDHRAGVLSFYSVSQTMRLIHRVHTTFTQPLCTGAWIKDTVYFPKLK